MPMKRVKSLFARLDERLQRAARPQRDFPFLRIAQVVNLKEIDVIGLQPFERAVQRFTRALPGALLGLGREEEAIAMARHPRAEAFLGLAVTGRRVDVIDAVFQQHVQHGIGFGLRGG